MNSLLKPGVLIVDPDPVALAQTAGVFSPHDFRVFTAVCRDSALDSAREMQLDLLIIDMAVDSPEASRHLIDEIYAIPERNDVPVIFTSGGQVPDVIRRQHDFGGAYHIRKPFDATVMVTIVERALWMPHLVQSHVSRPHFKMSPTTMAANTLPSAQGPVVTASI